MNKFDIETTTTRKVLTFLCAILFNTVHERVQLYMYTHNVGAIPYCPFPNDAICTSSGSSPNRM